MTKMIGAIAFPDEEQHFLRFPYAEHYQEPQRIEAMRHVTCWDLCLDVGAHVGIFSRHFATRFKKVLAFEPIVSLHPYLRQNTPANVEIVAKMVSDRCGTEQMLELASTNSGCSMVTSDPRIHVPREIGASDLIQTVESVSIDSLNLSGVGLIKIDVQGADFIALSGAVDTIRRCKPVVLVEEKPVGGPTGPRDHILATWKLMEGLGATRLQKVGADRVFVFKP